MILAVTPNPALDVTYRLGRLRTGAVNRVDEVVTRAGGKGVNVARVLHQLGTPCAAVGLGSGPTAERIVAELEDRGVDVTLVGTMPVRRTLVVHTDDGTTTSLWEPGTAPPDPDAAQAALLAEVEQRLDGAAVLTVSGSLPPGLPADLPVRLARLAATRAVPALLDLDGDPLLAAAAAGCAVLTPNSDELERLTGTRPGSADEAARVAEDLVSGGVPMVVATLGAHGVVAVRTGADAVHARLPEPVSGNPTGAGDAVCAAVAAALARARKLDAVDVHELARSAAAVGAAAVLRAVAGEIDPADVRRLLPLVVLEDV